MLSTIQLAKLQMSLWLQFHHELRTPLAVLMSAADNLADGLLKGSPPCTNMARYFSIKPAALVIW